MGQPAAPSRRCAIRLLRLLPSTSARRWSRWASPHGRVALILVGLRGSKSAPCGSLAGAAASGENAVINSSQVGWSRGRLLAQRGLTRKIRHSQRSGLTVLQIGCMRGGAGPPPLP